MSVLPKCVYVRLGLDMCVQLYMCICVSKSLRVYVCKVVHMRSVVYISRVFGYEPTHVRVAVHVYMCA